MKILLLQPFLNNRPNLTGFIGSTLIHLILVISFINFANDVKPFAQEDSIRISLDFFNPALEESIAQTSQEQVLADEEPIVENEAIEEEIVEEPIEEKIVEDEPVEEEITKEEPVIEEKPIPEETKVVIEEPKPKPKPKKNVNKPKPKPKPKTKSPAKISSKDATASITNIRPSSNQVGEFSFATSKGDDRFSKIQRAIKKHQNYPKRAVKMRKQGIVEISFLFKTNGTVDRIKILTSSGHEILDNAAIKTIQKAFKEFPILEKDYLIKIPMSYKLI